MVNRVPSFTVHYRNYKKPATVLVTLILTLLQILGLGLNQDSVVRTLTRLGLDKGTVVRLSAKAYRTFLGPTLSSAQWILGTLPRG